MKPIRHVLIAVALFMCGSCASQDATTDAFKDKSPDELLKTVRAKYLAAKSYRDEGIVKIDFLTERPHSSDKPFSTAFERGGRFLFTYHSATVPGRKPNDTYVVWSNDQVSFNTWWMVNGLQSRFDDFDLAMAGPSGVSGGSASAIIPLLRGQRLPLYWPSNPVDQGSETIDGEACRKITGTPAFGSSVTMWIDRRAGIRRIFTINEIDPSRVPPPPGITGSSMTVPREKFTTETTIELKPSFDTAISEEVFAFEVPTSKP